MSKSTSTIAKEGWRSTEGFRGVLFIAVFFDILSAIPWVGILFSGLGYGIIWMWLEMRGVKASLFTGDTKKLASTAAEFVGGAVGLGIIPGITMWSFFTIVEHKNQEQTEVADSETTSKTKQIKTSAYE